MAPEFSLHFTLHIILDDSYSNSAKPNTIALFCRRGSSSFKGFKDLLGGTWPIGGEIDLLAPVF